MARSERIHRKMKYIKLYEDVNEGQTFKMEVFKQYNQNRKHFETFEEYCESYTQYDCSNNSINSLGGIELFPNLLSLNISKNLLTTLDGIEILTKLKKLDIGRNRLRNLDGIEKLKKLEYLWTYPNDFLEKPIPIEIFNKFGLVYSDKAEKTLRDPDFQLKFLYDNPERIRDLIPIGLAPELEEIRSYIGE